MPCDYSKYPKNWKVIVAEIRKRSGGRCDCIGECGLHESPGFEIGGSVVLLARRCSEINGRKARYARGKVVLTVAHLDHNPQNSLRHNLRDMCQRCHLRYDNKIHVSNAMKTRAKKRGQLEMELK